MARTTKAMIMAHGTNGTGPNVDVPMFHVDKIDGMDTYDVARQAMEILQYINTAEITVKVYDDTEDCGMYVFQMHGRGDYTVGNYTLTFTHPLY